VLLDYNSELLRKPGTIDFTHFLETYVGARLMYEDIYYEDNDAPTLAMSTFESGNIRVFDEDAGSVRRVFVRSRSVVFDNTLTEPGKESLALFTGLHEAGHLLIHWNVLTGEDYDEDEFQADADDIGDSEYDYNEHRYVDRRDGKIHEFSYLDDDFDDSDTRVDGNSVYAFQDSEFAVPFPGKIGAAQVSVRNEYVEGATVSPVGYLEAVYVETDYRKKNAASSLVYECAKWAVLKGCRELASDCELNNTDGYKFHLSNGFKEVSRNVHFVSDLRFVALDMRDDWQRILQTCRQS
jgi:GNAT superfamily N-acetyltransferase